MKDKKKIIVIITLAILIFSGFQDSFSIKDVSLLMYQVKGFKIALFGLMLYLYFLSSRKKEMRIISIIVSFIGYLYTVYITFTPSSSTLTYGIGLYLYFASFISFIISIFVNGEKETVSNQNMQVSDSQESFVDSVNASNNTNYESKFLVCNYMSGLKGKEGIYKSLSVLVDKDNEINVNIKSDENIQFNIMNIKSIKVSKEVFMKNEREDAEDHSVENMYLMTVLTGSFGPMISQQLMKNNTSNQKVSFNHYYKIEIIYQDEEEHRILFQTRNDPKTFFEKYSDIYTEK